LIDAEETFRSYHRELLARLEQALQSLEDDAGDGGVLGSAVLSSLAEDFRRYVEANENSLYPAVAPMIRSEEQVMAPMILDVRAIGDYATEGERTALEALTASDGGRRARARRIRMLATHAEAVIRLHLEKLERIYLPLLAELSEEQRETVLAETSASYGAPLQWPEAPLTSAVESWKE
jgi:hemerythrin-like domain-containing protein